MYEKNNRQHDKDRLVYPYTVLLSLLDKNSIFSPIIALKDAMTSAITKTNKKTLDTMYSMLPS